MILGNCYLQQQHKRKQQQHMQEPAEKLANAEMKAEYVITLFIVCV
jgi:hypothetical protein